MASDEYTSSVHSIVGADFPLELRIQPPDGSVLVDAFEGPKLKFQRAQRHVAECNEANRLWAENYHDPGIAELDATTGETWYHFTMPTAVDPTIRLAAADALYNFRSALDQAISICVALTNNSTKNVYFPHGTDADAFEAAVKRGCDRVPDCVVALLRELEPWRGGKGETLRTLHDLNIQDKHNDLIKPSFQVSHAEMITEPDPRAHEGPHVGILVGLAFGGTDAIASLPLRKALEVIESQVGHALSGIVVQMGAHLDAKKSA